jgi:centromere-localized protein 2
MSAVLELETAVDDLEAEVKQMERDEAATMQQTRQIVESLSDLRYGRFSNSQLRDQIVEGLDNLRATCQR